MTMSNTAAVSHEMLEEKARKQAAMMDTLRKFFPLIGFVAILLIFSIATGGKIIQPRRLGLILNQVYMLMIACTGVWMVMTVGGLDFSQGSILGLTSMVFCWVSKTNVFLAVICAVVAGAVMGAFNGFFYVKFKVQSFIVTICTMYLFRGLCKYLATNEPVTPLLTVIDLDVPLFKAVMTIIILVVAYFFIGHTRWGYDLKAVGAGETASRFSGCRPDFVKFLVFVIAGAITGFASFINVIHTVSITGTAGSMLETKIMIALVLGGLPIQGGSRCRFSNIVIGTLTYCILDSSLPMVFSQTATQQLIKGIIFLAVVALTIDHKNLRVIK